MSHLSRIVSAVLILTTGLLLASCQQGEDQTEAHKIGAAFTLTGDLSYWSEQIQKGMDLALEEENVPGKVPIRVIYEDVQAQPSRAVSAYQKLSSVDKVSVVVSVFTPIGQPLKSSAESFGVPLLATITSAQDFATGEEWAFRDYLTQEQMAPVLGEYVANELGLKTASTLVVNDDYGLSGARLFSQYFKGSGGAILTQETFEGQDTEVRSQVLKILNQSPQAVFLVGRDRSLATAIRQLRELGFQGQIVSVSALDQPEVWVQAGSAVEDALFASAYVDYSGNPEAEEYRAAFQDRYREEPDHVTLYGYTMGKYLSSILREAEGDPAQVRDLLESLVAQSIRGRLIMTEEHDVLTPIAFYRIQNGEKVLVQVPDEEQGEDAEI